MHTHLQQKRKFHQTILILKSTKKVNSHNTGCTLLLSISFHSYSIKKNLQVATHSIYVVNLQIRGGEGEKRPRLYLHLANSDSSGFTFQVTPIPWSPMEGRAIHSFMENVH